MDKFLAELRRRNVVRVAGLYGVVGWLLAQAAGVLENALAMPGWFDTVVVSLLLIGLPIVLVFAWVFEMTPEGLRKTAEVAPETSIARQTGRKIDVALIASVVTLIVVLVGGRFIGHDADKTRVAGESTEKSQSAKGRNAKSKTAQADGDNSIAVLPFADMSPEKDQEYFADGISEELLNVLAQVKGLQVAGRTSSFAFKGDNRDMRQIGELLDVSHILEGSVRKAGDRVRITAQLVKAQDGFHLWSATYDRQLTDIFAVQDEIAGAILQEMTPYLPGAASPQTLAPAARADIGAYDLFLLAREKMTQDGSRAAYESAVSLLEEAITKDPNYAPALAWRSYAAGMLSATAGGVGDTPIAEALPVAKDYADRALAADPNSPEAMFAIGAYWGVRASGDDVGYLNQAIQYTRKAIELRPSFPQAQNDLAIYLGWTGKDAEGMKILRDVLAHDPGLRDANHSYIDGQSDLGNFDEAEAALARWKKIRPDLAETEVNRMRILMRRGRLAEALRVGEAVKQQLDSDLLNVFITGVHIALHDAEWLAANGTNAVKGFAALLDGDKERASRLGDEDPTMRANTTRGINNYVGRQYAAGYAVKAVAYYEEALKSPEGAVEAWNACGCSMAPLAAALKETGHKDFGAIMAAWKARADEIRADYAKSADFARTEADRAAIEGDFARAKKEYARAMDLGWREAVFLHADFRRFLPRDAEFDALRARMRSLLDAEREKLGMAPIPKF